MQLPTEDAVREALRAVDDPEVGMNIIDLGLVYRIEIAPERIHVDMTMTTPACPMGSLIIDQARDAIAAIVPDGAGVPAQAGGDACDLRQSLNRFRNRAEAPDRSGGVDQAPAEGPRRHRHHALHVDHQGG